MSSRRSGPDIEILPEEPTLQPSTLSANTAISAVLSHKARGNKLVSLGNFQSASVCYTDALISLPSENYLAPTKLALLTNRALCYLSTKQWDLCRKDCDAALALDQTNTKAWYRRAQAYYQLKQLKKAIQDLKQLLVLDPKNGRAKKLARAYIVEYNASKKTSTKATTTTTTTTKATTTTARTSGATTLKKKTTANSFKGGGLGLYDDKLDSDVTDDVRLLERIRTAANKASKDGSTTSNRTNSSTNSSTTTNSIEKTFAALLTPEGFKQRIFPGINLPEGFEAPTTLKEMLNDQRYNEALVAMMPDVVAKADSVIHNVKKKAALNGDIMDKATEEQLRPQILLEAFARTVTKIISQTSAAFVTQALRSSAPTASPDNEQADYNQLDESVVRACIGGNMHHNPPPQTTTTTTTTTTTVTTFEQGCCTFSI